MLDGKVSPVVGKLKSSAAMAWFISSVCVFRERWDDGVCWGWRPGGCFLKSLVQLLQPDKYHYFCLSSIYLMKNLGGVHSVDIFLN
jgi:hypothetical protein